MLAIRMLLAAHAVGEMARDRRGGEARGLQREQARADPERRVAHVAGEVDRQEREQRRSASSCGTTSPSRAARASGCAAARCRPSKYCAERLRPRHAPSWRPGACVPRNANISAATTRPGHDVDHHHLAPGEEGERGADHDRRDGIADVAAHAVQRKHQALALGIAAARASESRSDATGCCRSRPARCRRAAST